MMYDDANQLVPLAGGYIWSMVDVPGCEGWAEAPEIHLANLGGSGNGQHHPDNYAASMLRGHQNGPPLRLHRPLFHITSLHSHGQRMHFKVDTKVPVQHAFTNMH